MHDQSAVRTEGIADVFDQLPDVKAKVDSGYRGLAEQFPDPVSVPPLKPKNSRRAAARPRRSPPGTPPPGTAPELPAELGFRLADYLDQHGRTIRRQFCPPSSFWHAAYTHLTHPDDLWP